MNPMISTRIRFGGRGSPGPDPAGAAGAGMRRRVAAGTVASLGLVFVDSLGVTVALGRIGPDLGAPAGELKWILIAYSAALATLVRTGCALGRRFGARRVYTAGQVLLALASVLCALAPDAGWLIAGRAGQGAGAALILPTALADLGAAFAPRYAAALPGFVGGTAEWAATLGPLACALAVQGLGWRSIFWINVPLSLAALALSPSDLPERGQPGPRPRLAPLDTLVFGAGCLAVAWGILAGDRSGWGRPEPPAALGLGLALLVAHVRSRIPLAGFRLVEFAGARLSYLCCYAALFGTLLMFVLYFAAPGADALRTEQRMGVWCAGLLLSVPLSQPLGRRIGAARLVAAGLGLAALSLVVVAHAIPARWPYPVLAVPLAAGGCGLAVALPAARTLAGRGISRLQQPPIGAFATLRYFGGTLGFALTGACLDRAASPAAAAGAEPGYGPALNVLALVLAVGAAAALLSGRAASPPGSGLRRPARPGPPTSQLLHGHGQPAAHPQREHGLRDHARAGRQLQAQLPHDQRDDEYGFEHAQAVAHAEPRPGAERDVGVPRPLRRRVRPGALGAEPLGVEALRVGPERRVAVHRVRAHHHVRAGRHRVAADHVRPE